MLELKQDIVNSDPPPDIIAISELKPKNYKRTLTENEFKIPGYEFEHANLLKNDSTRGIAIYVHSSLRYSLINPLDLTLDSEAIPKEIVCVQLHLQNNLKMLFCHIYRNPSNEASENIDINNFIKRLGLIKFSHKIIVGDFNRRKINWETVSSPSEDDEAFIEACRDSLLSQHVLTPTRGRGTDNPSLIDLFLCSNEDDVQDVEVDSPLGKSDHSVVKVTYCAHACKNSKKVVFNYEKGDYNLMKKLMSLDWKEKLLSFGDDVDGMWEEFLQIYTECEQACIPKKCIETSRQRKLNRKGQSQRKKKQRLWKQYMSSKNENILIEYRKCRNQVHRLTRKAVKLHEKNIAYKIEQQAFLEVCKFKSEKPRSYTRSDSQRKTI